MPSVGAVKIKDSKKDKLLFTQLAAYCGDFL